MATKDELLGTTTFLKETKITASRMRLLEAAGVIQPIKADSGRRIFTRQDVATVKAHMARRPPNKYAAKTPKSA